MKLIKSLETENLILRKARKSDLKAIWENVWKHKIMADKMLWEVIEDLDAARDRLDKVMEFQKGNNAYFVCLKDMNEAIGFAGIIEVEKGIYQDCGICVSYKYQNLGYGKEVVKALIKLVFEDLNGEKFIYTAMHDNEISKKLCLSCGFKYFESEPKVRKHDCYKYISDHYYLSKNMYDNGGNL